jgi:hypothetical protein
MLKIDSITSHFAVIRPLSHLFRPKSTKTAGYSGLALAMLAIG